jgi:hypothetical protein
LRLARINLTQTYTPAEIASQSVRTRSMVQRLDVGFHDVSIEILEPDRALVTCTVRAVAKTDETRRETAEIQCRLIKQDRKWLFTEFAEVEVLQR